MGESHLSCVTHGNVTNVLDRLAGVVEVVYSGGGNLRTGSQARGGSAFFPADRWANVGSVVLSPRTCSLELPSSKSLGWAGFEAWQTLVISGTKYLWGSGYEE